MSAEASGWVLHFSPYSGRGLLCHLVVADTVNVAYGYEFYMGTKKLARLARCDESTARRWIDRAVADKLLTCLHAGGNGPRDTSRYRFNMPADLPSVLVDEPEIPPLETGAGRVASRHPSPESRVDFSPVSLAKPRSKPGVPATQSQRTQGTQRARPVENSGMSARALEAEMHRVRAADAEATATAVPPPWIDGDRWDACRVDH